MNIGRPGWSAVIVAAMVTQAWAGPPPAPVGNGFTYQGRLKENGSLPTGVYDMEFTLWDAAEFGNPVGPTVELAGPDAVNVTKGLFSVELDFGAGIFNGEALWLQIVIEGGPEPLSPRQRVGSVPQALHAAAPWETDLVSGATFVSSGRVGIRTSDPQQAVEIALPGSAGDPDGILFSLEGSTVGGARVGVRGTNLQAFYIDIDPTNTSCCEIFSVRYDGDNTVFYIDDDGSVGVGTTDPQDALDIAVPDSGAEPTGLVLSKAGSPGIGGTVLGVNGSNNQIFYVDIDPNDNTGFESFIIRYDGSNEVFHIDQNGNVALSATAPTERLTVNGKVSATNFTQLSDERWKRDVRHLDGSLAKILRLRGVSFDWDPQDEAAELPEGRQIGVIAQEVAAVLPEAVGSSGDYMTVSYDSLVPVLIEAVKEMDDVMEQRDAMIRDQREQLRRQQTLIDDLVRRVTAIEQTKESLE